jgi:hypothetical protein
VVGILDLASGEDVGECGALQFCHAQCMFRVAPDGVHLFLLTDLPADIKRPNGEMGEILVDWTKYPLVSDLDRPVVNH